jgi:hypothetical protein
MIKFRDTYRDVGCEHLWSKINLNERNCTAVAFCSSSSSSSSRIEKCGGLGIYTARNSCRRSQSSRFVFFQSSPFQRIDEFRSFCGQRRSHVESSCRRCVLSPRHTVKRSAFEGGDGYCNPIGSQSIQCGIQT